MSFRLRTSLIVSWLFIAAVSVCAQDIKPGASPAWVVGNPNAPVSIEVFNDYQCRPCGTYNAELKKIEAKYKDQVKIIFRNYPFTRTHPNALLAAQTAEAAGLQGHFIEMINQLYDNAKYWNESRNPRLLFKSYARKLHLDLDRFVVDLNGQRVWERIRLDIERAKSLSVNATPTVLINGKMVEYEMIWDLGPLIEQALGSGKP